MDRRQVIIRPVVSEKSYVLAAADKYTFRVHPDAHKTQIRQAVEALFDVKVVEVRTLVGQVQAQAPRLHLRPHARRGRRPSCRCAQGDTIPIFQGLRGGALSHADSQAQAHQRPAAASSTYPDFAEITKTEPEKTPRRGPQEVRRAQRPRPQDRPPPRRRRQAPVPQDRLQAPQGRRARPRSPRSSTTPTARPTSRCCTTSTARRPTSSRPTRLRVGMTVQSGRRRRHHGRQRLPLANMPVGTVVHNVELQPGRGGQLGRSAGAGIQLMAKEGDMATLRLPSGEMRMVRAECRATVGVDRQRRPPERQDRQGRPQAPHGRAPADARHGHEPGRPPARRRRGLHDRWAAIRVTPWGVPTLGYRTRKKGKQSDRYIVRGRRRGKKGGR